MTDHDHGHDHDEPHDLDADQPGALGDTANRPMGPDYGGSDTTDGDLHDTDATPARPREDSL